ncbi:MAG TPA: tetratricopeptide repeat protein [Coleofasciculaceae cyanobacterium]
MAYYNRGNAYGSQGKHTQALTDFGQALKFKPDLASAHLGQGIAYRLSGNRSNAIQAFKKTLELSQDSAMRQAAEQNLRELGSK